MADRRSSDTTSDAYQKPQGGWAGASSACTLLAYLSTALLFVAPLLVTLALKVNALVGIDRAPQPVAGRGGRFAGGDGGQPDLRPAERPDHVPVRGCDDRG